MQNEPTIFERILAGTIPAKIVYDDDSALAFADISPQAPLHVLVIPKRKVAFFSDLAEMPDVEAGKYFKAISKVAEHLGLNAEGYRVVFNCREHGQQTVDYLHAHILGGRQMRWPPG